MISKEEIKKLAELARIEIDEKEAESLSDEMDAILNYVGQIKEITGGAGFPSPEQGEGHAVAGGEVNVMREDEVLNQSGEHSEKLIAEFPQKEKNYLKVKKIL